MSNALGPVTSNRIASANKVQTKPELQKRLDEQVQRKTSAGTFKTSPDGRMEFTPKFVEDAAAHAVTATPQTALTHNQQVLERMRALKPAAKQRALQPGDKVRLVASEAERALLHPKLLQANELHVVAPPADDYIYITTWDFHTHGWMVRPELIAAAEPAATPLAQIAEPGEGDDEPVCSDDAFDLAYAATLAPLLPRDDAAKLLGMVQESYAALGMTQAELEQIMATPSFDPLTEPLDVGDYVQVVYRPPVGAEDMDRCGKRGMVVRFKNGNPMLHYEDGTEDQYAGWAQRSSLLLLRKASQAAPAFDAMTELLRKGDKVLKVKGAEAGLKGTVLWATEDAVCLKGFDCIPTAVPRAHVQLLEKAQG